MLVAGHGGTAALLSGAPVITGYGEARRARYSITVTVQTNLGDLGGLRSFEEAWPWRGGTEVRAWRRGSPCSMPMRPPTEVTS